MKIRRTKIVCTLGPASESEETIRALVEAGMDVARLNFAHGGHEQHRAMLRKVRAASHAAGRPVAVLQDLSGPKIRVGRLPAEGVELKPEQVFTLTTRPVDGNERRVFVSLPSLPRDVKPGDRILLADGTMEIRVEGADDRDVDCRVIVGGRLMSHKGINVPGATLSVEPLTDKDRGDLEFGLAEGVDMVALSFVRSAQDVHALRRRMSELGREAPIVAKLEQHEVLGHLDHVIEAADAVMVARGDLGVEIPIERVPGVQKAVIRIANGKARPVITATQMLRSMVESPRPTRAEASDVANAILDGTDAVMLSEETAMGQYPVRAVRMMDRIARETEHSRDYRYFDSIVDRPAPSPGQAIGRAACQLARDCEAAAIVAHTLSGMSARLVAAHRPRQPVLAPTPEPATLRALCLCWGVVPVAAETMDSADAMLRAAADAGCRCNLTEPGDTVVITAGLPVRERGNTNTIKLHTVPRGRG